jgi:hypothetical protein
MDHVSDAYLASVVQDWAKADARISKLQDKLDTCFDQDMKSSIRKCIAALQKSVNDRLATLSPRDEQRCRELHAAGITPVNAWIIYPNYEIHFY